jgi:dihydrofolate reductase
MISIIVAMANQRIIGWHGAMPWHMPADLAWFRQNTLNKPIIMGRATYQSIGKALPKRHNIVLTHNPDWQIDDVTVVHTPQEALIAAGDVPEIMIIGGAQIYQKFLPQARRLYLTLIDAQVMGDTYFPDYTRCAWQVREKNSHPADERNPYPYTFLVLER